ncbi:hypothetical protein FOL47_008631 [Perkinsus chesapeaki]|uniref:Uncharacterized protein n=3 Tax=Alveolata TaxID=33630 RepID=A0A7J6LCT5_PERCH|nr:hypothetical protein FOL47_008631 [Perkinsus chesapeaki]
MKRFYKAVRSEYNNARLLGPSRLCLLLSIFILLVILLIYAIINPWPYSPLDPHGKVKRVEHNKFMQEADAYFQPSPTLVVLTTPRQEPYIKTFLWSYLALNKEEPMPVLHILNRGDTDIPMEARNSPYVDVIDLDPIIIQDYDSWRKQLYIDHVKGLNECLKYENISSTSWCIIFENDAMLTDHFLTKFHKYVSKAPPDTAMVKLFVSDHWSGYEVGDIPYFIIFFVFSTTIITLFFTRYRSQGRFRALTVASVISGLLIILILLITKQQLLKLRYIGLRAPVSLIETDVKASTVATAYPQNRVKSIKDYLQREIYKGPQTEEGEYDLDFSQYDWAKQEGKILRTYPSLVQHMGLKSSADDKLSDNLYADLPQDSSFEIHYDSLIDDNNNHHASLPMYV